MFNFFFSPLEQFNLFLLNELFYNDFGLFFNTIIFYFFLILISFFLILFFFNKFYFFSVFQEVFESVYLFTLNIILQQIGYKYLKYYPFIYFVFFLFLFINLIGMFPFGFTITAHLFFTFYISLSFNLGFFFLGLFLNGFKFFELFIPKNAPKQLIFLITIIELVSYLIRTFSLSIRLFANMMAGHCLLYVISTFVFAFFNYNFLISFFPIIIIYFIIFSLEFAIAFLQAYVFTILLCIYLNDSLSGSH